MTDYVPALQRDQTNYPSWALLMETTIQSNSRKTPKILPNTVTCNTVDWLCSCASERPNYSSWTLMATTIHWPAGHQLITLSHFGKTFLPHSFEKNNIFKKGFILRSQVALILLSLKGKVRFISQENEFAKWCKRRFQVPNLLEFSICQSSHYFHHHLLNLFPISFVRIKHLIHSYILSVLP